MTNLADPFTHVIGDKLKTTQISNCNICGFGVFKRQQWVFSRKPLGICHVECLQTIEGGVR